MGKDFFEGEIVIVRRCTRFWRRSLATATTAALVFAVSLLAAFGDRAEAAENAKGIYLLGSVASMAGVVPPPGTYGTSIKYFYSGSASGAAGSRRM